MKADDCSPSQSVMWQNKTKKKTFFAVVRAFRRTHINNLRNDWHNHSFNDFSEICPVEFQKTTTIWILNFKKTKEHKIFQKNTNISETVK